MKRHSVIYMTIFVLMLALAAGDNIRGAMIPSLKSFFSIQNTQIGWMLIINSIGYMIGTYTGGLFCGKAGQQRVLQIGALISLVSLGIMASAQVYSFFLAGIFVGSIGVAFMGIAINTLIPAISGNRQALVMNLTHFCYGVGAMITQKISGVIVSGPLPWQAVFLYVFGFMIIAFVLVLSIRFPKTHEISDSRSKEPLTRDERYIAFLFVFVLGLFIVGEIQTGTWLINYIKVAYNKPESYAATFSALFFLTFSLGRLGGGFFVEKRGYLKSLQIAGGGAFVLYTAGWLLKLNGLYLISLSGLFYSIGFPTTVLAASTYFKSHSAKATGIVVTGATAINTLLSFLMGVLNDAVGVYNALLMVPVSLFFCLVFISLLRRKTEPRP